MSEACCICRSNVLIGVTGSVAAIKLEELAEKLSEFATIKIVTTAAAKHFLDRSGKWGSQAIGSLPVSHLIIAIKPLCWLHAAQGSLFC